MKISEVKALTGLTKKALNYYEENELIKPAVSEENGYRNYSDKDVEVLTQISTLRRFGLSIKEIKAALESSEAFLKIVTEYTDKLTKQINEMEKYKSVLSSCVNDLKVGNTDVKKVTEEMNKLSKALEMDQKEREGFMINEFERIFPGIYGKVLSFCFNSFLTEAIDSKEKENAWIDLVKALDNTPNLNIPEKLESSVDMDEEEWKTIKNRMTENLKNDNYEYKSESVSMMSFDMSEEEQRQFEVFCTYIKPEGNIEIIGKTLEAVDKSLSVLSSKYRKRKEAHLKFHEKFKEGYFCEEPSMPLTIVHKETMSFVGIHYTKFINKKDFPKFIREFNYRIVEISNIVNGEKVYGFSGIDSLGKDIVPDSVFSFVFAMQVSNIEKVPCDMISFVLPQHDYLFYKHIGDMKNYQKSLDEAFMYNIEEKNYEMDILPSFQIFSSDISDNDENLEVEMYFPVSKIKKMG
ncbi:MerR family transcriptional regulator [Clostridium hydrogenum]|uniref:MerR family transcriptional regulator n=1 Tax=Clostridium hydrogenum TaxID=2855764 RepID=UPI001F21A80E|nr:MerR family transcriptional regulator [Clostridium hydrogenum]